MDFIRHIRQQGHLHLARRHFLKDCSLGLAGLWLAGRNAAAPIPEHQTGRAKIGGKAKRVIFLHMAGGPSHLDLFDYKPELVKYDGVDSPQHLIEGRAFPFLQGVPKLMAPLFPFEKVGHSGQWMSDRLPHLRKMADELCVIRSMWTDQASHAPAQLRIQTGSEFPGAPAAGSWVNYGLGSENENLPGFVVLASGGKDPEAGKSAWGNGYLPGRFQGVPCRPSGEPVLYLSNPKGITTSIRRRQLDALDELNQLSSRTFGDPESLERMTQYETAFRMQSHASDAFDINKEPPDVHAMYGVEPGRESLANNCLIARRLAERGVRYIQLYDWGWDSHGFDGASDLRTGFVEKCRAMDHPVAALLADLKQRGLLDDTLVVWCGEFGRTPMRENRGGVEMPFSGRDHNPGGFTAWMAGGGMKAGYSHGETDAFGASVTSGRVSPHDLHATMLAALNLDHLSLTYPSQGVEQRLSNITRTSRVVTELFG